MAGYASCIRNLAQIAGRQLTDDEVSAIYERVHKAALDIKAGRVKPGATDLSGRLAQKLGTAADATEDLVVAAARKAAEDMDAEAALQKRQAYLQVVRLGARKADIGQIEAAGLKPLDAVGRLIARDYSGKVNIASLEQIELGYTTAYLRKLLPAWDALGNDFMGFFFPP